MQYANFQAWALAARDLLALAPGLEVEDLRNWARAGVALGYLPEGALDGPTEFDMLTAIARAVIDPAMLDEAVADSLRDMRSVFGPAFEQAFPDGFPHTVDDGASLTASERKAMDGKDFLLPARQLLPIHDEPHWRAARGRIFNVKGITASQRKALVAKWEAQGKARGWLQDAAKPATDERTFPPKWAAIAHLIPSLERAFGVEMGAGGEIRALSLDEILARKAAMADAQEPAVRENVAGLVHGLLDALVLDAPLEELTDWVAEDLVVLEDATERPMRLKVLLSRANVRNGNRRIYPLDVMQDAVMRGRSKLATQRITMEREHPQVARNADGAIIGFATNPDRDAAVIDALYMVGERVYIDVTLLDTPYGRAVAQAVRDGQKPRVSLRSLGRLRRATVGGVPTNIATFIDWHGGDWVDNPALLEAGPEAILTDAQVYEALLDSAKEELDMNEIQKLEAQLKALKDDKGADQAEIARLTQALADAKLEATQKELADAQAALAAKTKEVEAATAAAGTAAAATDAQLAENKTAIATLTQTVDGLAGTLKQLADDRTETAKRAEAAKAKDAVKSVVDSLATREELKRFNATQQKLIADRVGRATTAEAAEQALADAIQMIDDAVAATGQQAMGFQAGAGQGGTTGATTPKLTVTDNPKPWKAVVDKFEEAYRDHGRLSNTATVDPSILAANKPFVDHLLEDMAKVGGQAVLDSAELVLDHVNGTKALGDSLSAVTDSTGVSNLWNQPVIAMAILAQQFQQTEAMQFVQGFGPGMFEKDSKLGSVLRVPVETVDMPAGYDDPYYNAGMLSAEGAAIPELVVNTNWLSFMANWRRLAFSLTAEAEAAMMNGPLAYDAWARHTYALAGARARTMDIALYEEMLLTADEYNAVAVANEAVAAGEWTYAGGGSAGGYGANVCGVAQLLCGGVTTASNKLVPIVRERITTDLKANGQLDTTVTANAFAIAVLGGVTQVRGYLGKDGQIHDIPGAGTATYAIDWLNGKVLFKVTGTSGAAAGVRPTISYTYATNFDVFNLSNPVLQAGETIENHYAKLLIQMDLTAAGMGSAPRFIPPDLALMSFNIAALVQNASTFQTWSSAPGSKLALPRVTSNSKFAEKAGVELAKINSPWSAADARILLQRNGSTKFAAEVPFQIQGPYPKINTATGLPLDVKTAFGREKSVIATPQVKDQNGVIRNPVSRTIRLT